MTSTIKDDEIREEDLCNIFNSNYKPLKFFKDYAFLTYHTLIHESKVLISLINDYSREPIKIRKGMKANKKYKKHKKVWVPVAFKYHRSRFTKKGCLLSNNELLNSNKIKLLNFFFKWQKKRTRAYCITKIQKNEGFINEGDQLIITFICYKASFKKIMSNLEKDKRILKDYKRIRRRAHPVNFKFMFYDLDKNNQDLMFDFSGQGYDDCNLLITCNSYYIKYFEDFEHLYNGAVDWQNLVWHFRVYSLNANIYLNKYNFLFEFWKAYKINYWFRKYWDPEWPKIIGKMMSTIRYYNREHIINTKRIEKKVSREEAIRLVEEDRLRARAENIILKEQMKEKLAILEWGDYLKWTRELIEKYKKKGVDKNFGEALNEIRLWRIEYDKWGAELIARNKEIAKERILEEKKNFEPKKRDLRIFNNYK